MEQEKHHIVGYKVYIYVLLALLVLTGLSVAVTSIELGALTVAVALILAATKGALVLIYFMHLKFDSLMLRVMVSLVLAVFAVVLVVTLLDYLYM